MHAYADYAERMPKSMIALIFIAAAPLRMFEALPGRIRPTFSGYARNQGSDRVHDMHNFCHRATCTHAGSVTC